MKFVKSLHCATLTNEDLKELIHTALTSYRVARCRTGKQANYGEKAAKITKIKRNNI